MLGSVAHVAPRPAKETLLKEVRPFLFQASDARSSQWRLVGTELGRNEFFGGKGSLLNWYPKRWNQVNGHIIEPGHWGKDLLVGWSD